MRPVGLEGKSRLPAATWNTMFADVMHEIGKILIIFGAVSVLLGFLLWSGVGAGWLGRLPGDIRIEREHSTFFFPIITCVILSIVLSLLFALFRR